MVLGVYYLTMEHQAKHKGDGRAFADMDEVELAYQLEQGGGPHAHKAARAHLVQR